jgi:hypothetical protein
MELPASVQKLVSLVERETAMTPARAAQFLQEADIQPEDLEFWLDYDHPVEHGYGRKLAYDGDFFEIMVMSWQTGDCSAIHDHGGTRWGAVQCFGRAEHAVFSLQHNHLATRTRSRLEPGDINAVDHDLIHQMGNPDQPPFCSLHLYGSEAGKGRITANARIFDLFEGKIQLTDGGVFFCLPEHQINVRLPGPEADADTTVRHHQDMLDRIGRILKSGPPVAGLTERASKLKGLMYEVEEA